MIARGFDLDGVAETETDYFIEMPGLRAMVRHARSWSSVNFPEIALFTEVGTAPLYQHSSRLRHSRPGICRWYFPRRFVLGRDQLLAR
jgi:hypothetical protein